MPPPDVVNSTFVPVAEGREVGFVSVPTMAPPGSPPDALRMVTV